MKIEFGGLTEKRIEEFNGGKGAINLLGVVSFSERTGRAMGDALTAKRAVGFPKFFVFLDGNGCS